MSHQRIFIRPGLVLLAILSLFLWTAGQSTSNTTEGFFGVDAFGSYDPISMTLDQIKTYFQWEAERIATAGITWNRTLSPAGGSSAGTGSN